MLFIDNISLTPNVFKVSEVAVHIWDPKGLQQQVLN